MRKILIPVAAAAVAFSSAAFAQTGGASGTSGGAAAKSGSDATAPASMTAKDGMAKGERKMTKKRRSNRYGYSAGHVPGSKAFLTVPRHQPGLFLNLLIPQRPDRWPSAGFRTDSRSVF